jgi:hypothetical protein
MVDLTLLRLDRIVEPVEIGQISGIALHAGNVLADLLHGRVQLLLAAPGDEDIGAFLDKQLGSPESHPRCRSGDDCDFSLKFLAHDAPPKVGLGERCGTACGGRDCSDGRRRRSPRECGGPRRGSEREDLTRAAVFDSAPPSRLSGRRVSTWLTQPRGGWTSYGWAFDVALRFGHALPPTNGLH